MALEDLLQGGWLGGLVAAWWFTDSGETDTNEGAARFPAYARKFIRHEISEAMRFGSKDVVISEDVWKRTSKASTATVAAAEGWDITEELDRPAPAGHGFHETLAAPPGFDQDLAIDLETAIATLTEQERRVILALLDDEPMTDVADELGVTKSRISHVKRGALAKLAKELEGYS